MKSFFIVASVLFVSPSFAAESKVICGQADSNQISKAMVAAVDKLNLAVKRAATENFTVVSAPAIQKDETVAEYGVYSALACATVTKP